MTLRRGYMPLYKSAQAHSEHDEVIIFEPEKAKAHDIIKVEEPQGFRFDFPFMPEAKMIEVSEAPHTAIHNVEKTSTPKDIWDWQTHGVKGLLGWVQDRINSMPTHTGETSGIERLINYLKRLNVEISKAISTDFEGHIDVKTLESARRWIYDTIGTLEDAYEALMDKHYKKKKSYTNVDDKMVKEARTPYTGGIIVTVPLIISRCARVCINGTVSAGHDLSKLYSEQVKKYSLNTREQAELAQHLEDMGFPLRTDRLMLPDEEIIVQDGRGDLSSNYYA